MNIVIAFSPNWARYVAIEIYSIIKTNPGTITFFLLSDQLERKDLQMFDRLEQPGVKVYCIHGVLEELYKERIPSDKNVDSRFTKYTLYRLLIPEIINKEKILYIDADAVVNGDLSEFYNIEFQDNLIAGCTDTGILESQLNAIGLKKGDTYINAGVALWNLAKMRELDLGGTWIREINDKYYSCHDQDVINMTCQGKTVIVDPKYNVSLSTKIISDDIRIMHYAGAKPWNTSDVPNYQIWQRWANEYAKNS